MIANNTYNQNPKPWTLFLLIVSIAVAIMVFASCSGCKRELPSPQPTAPQVIEQRAKPQIDSLVRAFHQQVKRADSLQDVAAKAVKELNRIKKKAQAAIAAGDTAIKEADCTEIADAFLELKAEHTNYVNAAEQQFADYYQALQSKDSALNAGYAVVELEKSKFKQLAVEYDGLGQKLSKTEKQLAKTERKLKRAKFFNKVFIPGAIGMGAALGLILF